MTKTRNDYNREATQEIARDILAAGFRVFLAESGTYGFYTDQEGQKVISFQLDLCGVKFSGNYKTDQPRQTGNGWGIAENDTNYKSMIDAYPPHWAVGDSNWQYTTLEMHLSTYQSSSKYKEV